MLPFSSEAQYLTILDEQDQELIGVEVYTEDLRYGEVTDESGRVSLDGLADRDIISLRYLGYKTLTETKEFFAKRDYVISMQVDEALLDELVILGRKTVESTSIPYQVESISIEEIQSQEAQTSADALANQGGVYVQKSQLGGGSPVIRGFEANRVLLVIDNIRLNNAIYRSGHLQNAITVDQAMLDRVDVIYGPNSLIYGSDALGGVVNFKTRDPKLSHGPTQTSTEANYYIRYASANDERSAHLDMNYGASRWAALTSITFSSYGDLRTGNNRDSRFPDFGKRFTYQSFDVQGSDIAVNNPDPNVQVGSGYSQLDLLHKILFVPNNDHRLTANFQYSTSSDVPRYDNLSEVREGQLRWAEWSYGPQNRLLAALDYRHLKKTKFYDQLTVIGSYQHIDEDRITRLFHNPIRSRQDEDVDVAGLTIDASKDLTELIQISYGADLQLNDVGSNLLETDVRTGENVAATGLSRYASDLNKLSQRGIYISLEAKSRDERHHISGGARYANTSYQVAYDRDDPILWPEAFYEGLDGSNSALTYSLGSSHRLGSAIVLKAMVGTAFRSPNIDDLAKIRINSDEITFPNLDLVPERSTSAEITVGWQPSAAFELSSTAFYTRLNNAIVRRPFVTPDGSSIWEANGEVLQVVANQNAQVGRIRGVSINAKGSLSTALSYVGSINLTSGRELADGIAIAPLAHIPPVYGRAGLHIDKDRWSAKAIVRYNGMKPIEDFGSSADNPDLATPIGSLSWSTFNLYSTYKLTPTARFSLSIENVFDKHYRPFAAGISAPGRNIILSIRGNI